MAKKVSNLNDYLHGDRADIKNKKAKTTASSIGMFGPSNNGHGSFEKCAHSHPPLKLPGTDKVVYGGSCHDPAHHDGDVYIALDGGWRPTQRSWPWKKSTEFLFKIVDMSAPSDPVEFKKLIKYLKKQIDGGSKVHIGCIGGHGRTGTVLAALVAEYGEVDAISYVRQNYCQRAVESTTQVKFLNEYFGVTPQKGYKSSVQTNFAGTASSKIGPGPGRVQRFDPIEGVTTVWGRKSKGKKDVELL